MNRQSEHRACECSAHVDPEATASELNNLLHIIAGTADMLGNIWQDSPDAEKYVAMMRASIDRATAVTAELIDAAARTDNKIILHPAVLQQVNSFHGAPAAPAASAELVQRLLVVDDEPMVLELAKEFLTANGFDVITADNGCECLSIFGGDPDGFALVVLDLAMPLMNGEETFDRLQVIKPDVRVVLNTGFIDRARAEAMLARGLLAVLPKPLRAEEYVVRLRSLLSAEPAEMERENVLA